MIAGNQPFTVENSEQLWVTLSRLVRDLDVVLRFLHTHSLARSLGGQGDTKISGRKCPSERRRGAMKKKFGGGENLASPSSLTHKIGGRDAAPFKPPFKGPLLEEVSNLSDL